MHSFLSFWRHQIMPSHVYGVYSCPKHINTLRCDWNSVWRVGEQLAKGHATHRLVSVFIKYITFCMFPAVGGSDLCIHSDLAEDSEQHLKRIRCPHEIMESVWEYFFHNYRYYSCLRPGQAVRWKDQQLKSINRAEVLQISMQLTQVLPLVPPAASCVYPCG